MKNTLMILAHPSIETSIGNRIISETIRLSNQMEIRSLYELYPDFKVNIEAEQQALLKADIIIFQYPLFWYSVPALLKQWIDEVFQYGFAFGKDGYQLEGKKVIISFTMGSSDEEYPPDVLEKILFPFQGLAKYCKMEYRGEVLSNNINDYTEENAQQAKLIAQNHTKKLQQLLKNSL